MVGERPAHRSHRSAADSRRAGIKQIACRHCSQHCRRALYPSCSPVRCNAPTRRRARAVPGVEATVVDALVEYDYGQYEGLTSAEIEERHPGWNLFHDGCPGGESLHQVVARCDSFIAKLERTAAGRAAIVFTHGHLSRILTTRLVGLAAPGRCRPAERCRLRRGHHRQARSLCRSSGGTSALIERRRAAMPIPAHTNAMTLP